MTIREALKEGTSLLENSENPGLDAALLLAEILKVKRASLLIMGKSLISQEDKNLYIKLLKRRNEGECIAYILGKKEFYGLDFYISPAVLVPRPDTETLVEMALEIIKRKEKKEKKKKVKVLDLCTGSGAVGIALKYEIPELEVWASDISPEALAVAQENCSRHKVQIQLINSDLFASIKGKFDLIVSNPPYIASEEIKNLVIEVQREPLLALDGGKDGLEIILRIIKEAMNHLIPCGTLLMEADPEQMESIKNEMEKQGFKECRTYKDLSGQFRVISSVK